MKKSYRKWLIIVSSILCLSLLLFLIYNIQTHKEKKVIHMEYITVNVFLQILRQRCFPAAHLPSMAMRNEFCAQYRN